MVKIGYRHIVDELNTYIPGKPIEDVKKEFKITEVIKLASNENPLGPSSKVIDSLKNHISSVSLYPDGSCNCLRDNLAQTYNLPPECFIIGNGSDEILMLIAQTFINPGDEVLISSQTFSEYLFTSKCLEASIKIIPQKDFRYDIASFPRYLTEKTKVIYLCNPNNPTGTIYSKKDFDDFIAQIPANVLIVIDEAYYEYVNKSDYPESINYLSTHNNVLILRTFSKVYGLAGLRIGYAIGNKKLVDLIHKVREPFNVNSLAQIAAIAALKDQEYVQKIKLLNEQSRQYLYDQFDKLEITYIESEANFVLFEVKENAQDIFQKLLKKGIIVRPMNGFGLPNHVRVTTGTLEETKEFIEKLKEILTEKNVDAVMKSH
ncbi:MAG: histidinol-phosphate transaminase [Candidatus Margulisiibacteriota bacterium]|nr:MAG: histidinol-phosphate transaminase [Candidatus Margulisbacteria bacterium GWD2_39_127]OGI05240.1 MAG: histidinol-phosphate transaminase [Candidatus Margulisbacteria bacterium GWF2_38_17]OGI06289.1 MAG: histidinol-phosphate transaminase [Candidatus Margulisbacteria bacterium GWE2_39_32]PZM78946.1 MAG: histidinol-phosphate transaminase [Candidatus Margulisiibacteriota bacterium]HAR64328.1 histidinol-phosphate transaminase [Candidatus Margulisiibacteriota bacterium]